MAVERIPRKQFKTILSRLNRSRLAKPSTGSALENVSKLLQVLAIFVGGAWVLMDYLEFKKSNNELLLEQGRLAVATGQITRDLNEFKLARSREGRLDVAMDSSIVRSTSYGDGTFLYRYSVSLRAKDISDSVVVIPAIVVESFVGTILKDALKQGEMLYVNTPNQWQDEAVPGSVSWVRKGVMAESRIESPFDDQVKEDIRAFPRFGGNIFIGGLRSEGQPTLA